MPFGMGPAGWFYLPYFARYFSYLMPYAMPYMPYLFPWFPFFSPQQEVEMLKAQEKFLQDQLNWIEARIKELQGKQ